MEEGSDCELEERSGRNGSLEVLRRWVYCKPNRESFFQVHAVCVTLKKSDETRMRKGVHCAKLVPERSMENVDATRPCNLLTR
jgi:hypothetical protein